MESWHATAHDAALAYDDAIRRVLSCKDFPRHRLGGKGSYTTYVARLNFPTIRERRIRGEDVEPPPPPRGPLVLMEPARRYAMQNQTPHC